MDSHNPRRKYIDDDGEVPFYPNPGVAEVCDVIAAVWNRGGTKDDAEVIVAALGGATQQLVSHPEEQVASAAVVADWALTAVLDMCGPFHPDDVVDWGWLDDFTHRLEAARTRTLAPHRAWHPDWKPGDD
jgi:hypothetical protein